MARVIYWFRTDLRLHDSPALQAALDLQPAALYPVFTFDPHYVYEQLNLSDNITQVNSKSQLFVVRGPPTTLLPALFDRWKITHLVFEEDDDEYTLARDATVTEAAEKAGVKVITRTGHTLWDAKEILAKHNNKPITSYNPFVKIIEALPEPARPLTTPENLPNPGSTEIDFRREHHPVDHLQSTDVNAEFKELPDYIYETFSGPDKTFSVPTFEQLSLLPATTQHRGGETRALEMLNEWLTTRVDEMLKFEKPKTSPAAFAPAQTTIFSPHLKFGTLSVRSVYWGVKDAAKGKKLTQPPVSLLGQVYWREFFHCANTCIPNFQRMRGNPVCRYINWKLQNQYDSKGNYIPRKEYKFNDPEAEEQFNAWSEGRTGFPWIDAIMRQLRLEGWIHHLARHSVACFLTRGHLYISWERGAEVFDKFLVDWDPSSNAGNWMWLSASAFFHSIYRVYSPIAFGKKWDKTGIFIRKYCPELKDMPDKFIYEPWKAPIQTQKQAKCIIGQDYPKPIVDEKEAKAECLRKMEAAYEAKLHGDDATALDGSAADRLEGAEVDGPATSAPSAPGHKRKASSASAAEKDPKQAKLDGFVSKSPKLK